MSNAAPVCQIDPVINTQQPAATALPAIPIATDLASALAAINALSMWVRHAQSRLNPTPPQPQGITKSIKATDNTGQGRWTRVSQQTQKVRVYNPQDNTQYVDVEQITGLTMGDTKTGEKWIWKR